MKLSIQYPGPFSLLSFPVFGFKTAVYDINKGVYSAVVEDSFFYAPIVWIIKFKPFKLTLYRHKLKIINSPTSIASKKITSSTLLFDPLKLNFQPSNVQKKHALLGFTVKSVNKQSVIPEVIISNVHKNVESESFEIITNKISKTSIFKS